MKREALSETQGGGMTGDGKDQAHSGAKATLFLYRRAKAAFRFIRSAPEWRFNESHKTANYFFLCVNTFRANKAFCCVA